MLWFFEKGGDRLHYEIRRSFDEGRYELSIRYPDGFERLESFEGPSALIDGAVTITHQLQREGWTPIDLLSTAWFASSPLKAKHCL